MTAGLTESAMTLLLTFLYLFALQMFMCMTISRDMEDTEREDRTMDTNKDTWCSGYLGVACIDGTCPKANREEYMERGIPVTDKCEDCGFRGGCEDCYFRGTKYCDKRDTDFRGVVIHENTPDLYEPTEGSEHL